ncbi:MAG: dienelactone hydrolase family protein [Flavobacterium sp.]|nr:dienelactone hydrolase family protein [Flavobacterium sp.]
MHKLHIIKSERKNATKALILLHGRGSTAKEILTIASSFNVNDYSLYAPQATNHSWYPLSFLAQPDLNEPWLTSALELVDATVQEILGSGIAKDSVYFFGFSQGACLTLEYVTRNAVSYGGVVAFTGGLIGDKIYPERYKGNFEGTKVLLATANPDVHVPVERVESSAVVLKEMGAVVVTKVYPNIGHTINADEIRMANELIFNK